MSKKTTWLGLKKGTKFKAVSNSNSHNYVIDKTYEMSYVGQDVAKMNNIAKNHTGNSLDIKDVVIISETTVVDLTNEIKEYEALIKENKEKIEFCKLHGLSEYNQEIHRLHNGVKVIESSSTTMEKVIALKKLLES